MLKVKSAFSLIELSIVILVIGVLISGFSKYDKIITKFRLISARTQTASSPVTSIKNLVVWYETTSEKSFINSESEDGLPVSIWHDINPQLALKRNATAPSESERPFYKISNFGLPMLYFNGFNSLALPNGTIPSGDSAFTIFIVNSCICTNGYATLYSVGNWSANTKVNYMRYFGQITMEARINSSYQIISAPPQIRNALITYTNTYNNSAGSKGMYIYRSGNLVVGPSAINSGLDDVASDNGYIGRTYWGGEFFFGYIGEVIIYNRYLTTEERKAVEAYLDKKWGTKKV